MTTILLTLFYPLLIAGRVLNRIAGRDPLRRRPPQSASLWIERAPSPSDSLYFSEASPSEGRGNGGFGKPAERALVWLAQWSAPPREQPREKFTAAADREQGIPDEMYTLW